MSEVIDFSDIPEQGQKFFSHAKKRQPLIQKNTVLVDRDVYEWFQAQLPEPDSSRLVSKILREYMERQQAKSSVQGG